MCDYESVYVLHEDGKDDIAIYGYSEYIAYYLKYIRTYGKVTKWMYHERKNKVVINHLQVIRCY